MEGHRCQQITSNERCPWALRLSNHRGSEGPPLSTEYLKGALRHQGPHRLRHHRGSEGPPLSTKYLISERLQRQTRTTFSRSEGPPLSTKYLICERLQRQTRTTRGRARGHRFQQNTSSAASFFGSHSGTTVHGPKASSALRAKYRRLTSHGKGGDRVLPSAKYRERRVEAKDPKENRERIR